MPVLQPRTRDEAWQMMFCGKGRRLSSDSGSHSLEYPEMELPDQAEEENYQSHTDSAGGTPRTTARSIIRLRTKIDLQVTGDGSIAQSVPCR